MWALKNLEMISNFEGWGLNLLAYEKKSVCEPESNEFEKWRAIRASLGGVGGMLEKVAWVAC